MNISRTTPFTRLSPLSAKKPGPSAPPPEPPENNHDDKASLSGKMKAGAGILLGVTVIGAIGGIGGYTPQVQVRTVPNQASTISDNELEIGKQAAQQIEKQYKVWQNPEQQSRLDSIGQRLAQTSTRPDIPFRFKILDTDDINAMALPGGNVYATRGLMEKFTDNDQLAFVLGHEIAHAEQHHSMAKMGEIIKRRTVTLPLAFRQWNLSKFVLNAGDDIVGNRYGQPKETEADKLGQEHIARMGIDPEKAADAMQHLMDLTNGKNHVPAVLERILSDHPPTQERVDSLRQWASEIKARQ